MENRIIAFNRLLDRISQIGDPSDTSSENQGKVFFRQVLFENFLLHKMQNDRLLQRIVR